MAFNKGYGFILLFIFFAPVFLNAQTDSTNVYSQKAEKWYVPDYLKLQFAGNIGFVSLGAGYSWWNQKAQSDLIYGYVPEYHGNARIHTFTQKNTFRLINFEHRDFDFSVTSGFSVSFEPGQNSYVKIPNKYPDGYYSPNCVYACFFLGNKLTFAMDKKYYFRKLETYFEINALADYIFYNIIAGEERSSKIFSFAVGLHFFFPDN